MITLIEALFYRSLRYISQPLEKFHVLVGPNASGKTNFMDAIAFLGRLVSEGLDAAIEERTSNFQDLVWNREDRNIELAVEAQIPHALRRKEEYHTIRYEVSLGRDADHEETKILRERVLLKSRNDAKLSQSPPLFRDTPKTLITSHHRGTKTVVSKTPEGNDVFTVETGKGWNATFTFGHRRSAFGNLPEDESKFPVATWFKRYLSSGVHPVVLNPRRLRAASPPESGVGIKPDGSNLPWAVDRLKEKRPEQFQIWLAHLRTFLPDLEDIRAVAREEDRHKYLMLRYRSNVEVPSWAVSDGTLRFLTLTLFAYSGEEPGIYLVEEPENGLHPRAVEGVVQSLSSVYNAQVLLSTHSPVLLSVTKAKDVLCFAKTAEGATCIVQGTEHPALKDWQGDPNLSVLFAAGVLG